MKKILIVLSAALVLYSCGSKPIADDETTKRQQLQELKQQVHDIEQQIQTLEAELALTEKEEIIPVKVAELESQVFEHFIEVTGKVEAELDVDVHPETAGVITQVFVSEGEWVKKGDVLARLSTDVLDRTVDELNVQLELANTNYERQKNLWNQNIGSEMQFLQAKNNKESLEKRIASIKTQIEMAEVKSPVEGVVDVIYQKKGNIGGPQVPFAKVINTSKIKVYADVSESYITKIKNNDPVEINFPALGKTVNANIYQIGNSIDPNNRTFRIRINLNNPQNQIKPNLVSVVKLRDYINSEAVIIPSLFIKQDFKGDYTYIAENQNGKSVARKVYVKPGITDNNITEVVEGLEPGMKIISEGYNQIVDGTTIKF